MSSRFCVAALIFIGLLWGPVCSRPVDALPEAGQPAQIIVVLRRASSDQSAASIIQREFSSLGLQQLLPLDVAGPRAQTDVYLGYLAPDTAVDPLITELSRSPFVVRVEPNVQRELIDIDPITGPLDEAFQNGYQDYYRDIGVLEMWGRAITGNNPAHPITVAVIDTGVDLDHPDIDDNLLPGYDFVESDTMPQDTSSDSHGSMVAGIIGAEINNDIVAGTARGVAGIGGGDGTENVPGLSILPIRVAENLDCAQSAQAIDYARTQGADVINMSYGGESACQLELEAVQRAYDAGIALVAGAGNNNASAPFYPAAYGHGTQDDLVFAVAGVYASGAKGDLSNYGEWVDIAAPYRQLRSLTKNGGYQSASGTSYSAPLVSGLVGLLMSNHGWSRQQTFTLIRLTAVNIDAVNPGYEGLLGHGRINADAVSQIQPALFLPLIRHETPD